MTSLMNADPSSSSSSGSTPRSGAKARIGIDKVALFSKLQAASPASKGGTIDRRAILAAMKKPKTPGGGATATATGLGAGNGSASPGAVTMLGVTGGGSSTPLSLSRNFSTDSAGIGGGSGSEESRRLVRKLQDQLQEKTTKVESLEDELYQAKQQILDVKQQQLKDVDDLKKQYPKLEEEHSEIFRRLQQSQADSLVMLNNNRELKKTCDTFLAGQKDISKQHSELDRLQRENELLQSRLEDERSQGKLSLPVVDETVAHAAWNSAEIREKTEAMDHAFGALSSFHEMYLSDVAVEHGDASSEEIQQHSLELQMACVEAAAQQLGLLEPKKVEAMKRQNEALRAALDEAQADVVAREREIKVLESKHSDRVTIDRVELAELRANEAALQTELASQRIAAAAEASRAEMESNELRRATSTSRDSYETLQAKVRSLQEELAKMKALSAKMEASLQRGSGPETTSTAQESARNAQLLKELGEMKQKATDLERSAKYALRQQVGVGSNGPQGAGGASGISQAEIERQNVALKSEISVLRETLGLSTSYPRRSTMAPGGGSTLAAGLKALSPSHSSGSIAGSEFGEEKQQGGGSSSSSSSNSSSSNSSSSNYNNHPAGDGDGLDETPKRDQRLQLLHMRLSGFFSKHDQGMLKAVQRGVQDLKFNSALRERPLAQCHVVLAGLLWDLKEQPDFAARSFSAGELFDDAVALVPDESDYGDSVGEDAIERSIGAILVGLEEYFVDYGFFIGWDQGENIGSGLVFPHLAFREGAVEM